MVEFFRFRSTDALLDKYQELENRTIYFASPEELNDPIILLPREWTSS